MFKISSHRNLRARVVALLVVAFGGLLGAQALPNAEAATNGRSGKFVPATGAYFGMWTRDGDMSQANVKAQVGLRESQLGRKLDIDHHFFPFTSTIPNWKIQWDIDNGRIPLIAWAAYDTNPINAGLMDDHIRATAQRLKAVNSPIFLRWFWEPEWAKVNGMTNGTANYISAYRRIHNIFQQEAASNVAFVYCATSWGYVTGTAQSFYPGDAYVDWVCSDGYNFAPAKVGAKWESFDTIFRSTHDFAVAHNKPMMVGETGLMEGAVGAKAQWFVDAASVIKTSYPNLAAFLYFDGDLTSVGEWDWRLSSSASSLNAWIAMGNDPYFNLNQRPNLTTTTAAPSTTTAAPTTTTAAPTTTTVAPTTTTIALPVQPLFSDGFESKSFSAWQAAIGATVSSVQKQNGSYGAVLSTTDGGSFLRGSLAKATSNVAIELQIKVVDDPNLTMPILRIIGDNGVSSTAVALKPSGEVVLREPRTQTTVNTGVFAKVGVWHQIKLVANTSTGAVKLYVNGSLAASVSATVWRGKPVNRFEVGDAGGRGVGKTYTLAFDAVRAD